ncbi:MAG TPA: hypothetical protein VIX91_24245, partial [Candidatus Acidoferrum sp.]
IMAGAGLTHGGLYSYFESKSDLYVEVLGCFFTDGREELLGRRSWTWRQATWGRKLYGRLCRGNILRTWRIRAR